jgi:Leucine-rich repeat (LRR) protein
MVAGGVLDAGGPVCNVTTTFLSLGDATADLSPCRESVLELELHYVDFSLIAAQVSQLSNLQSLAIYHSTNVQLPPELARLRQLTSLETIFCELHEWPEVLQRMPQLTHLTLKGSIFLFSLPPWLGKLRNLVSLDLSFNYLSEIGDEIGLLPKLESFTAIFTYAESLSSAIARLARLRVIDMSYSHYLRLPASLAQLTQLEVLNFRDSSFPCVPDVVRAMPILADTHYFDYVYACKAIPRPIGYSQTRNDACLWDAYYGFWYKAACDGERTFTRLIPSFCVLTIYMLSCSEQGQATSFL